MSISTRKCSRSPVVHVSGYVLRCVITRSRFRRVRASRVRGAAVLELILVLPLMLIALMAIVEFGLLYSNEQNVEMSSRAGVQVASRLTTISSTNGDPVPTDVVTAVAAELAKIGVIDYRIRLEHNIDFETDPLPTLATPVVLTTTSTDGPTSCPDPPAITLSPNRRYVRVTVCVYSSAPTATTTGLTPNLLETFGIDMSIRVSQQTTTRRYAQ